jgi:hypothetical protein
LRGPYAFGQSRQRQPASRASFVSLSSLRAETKLEVCARLQHMHDLAQNQPMVFAFRPWLVYRQMRLDIRPLLVVEPKKCEGIG